MYCTCKSYGFELDLAVLSIFRSFGDDTPMRIFNTRALSSTLVTKRSFSDDATPQKQAPRDPLSKERHCTTSDQPRPKA